LRENYFKWLLQVISNPRLVADEYLEGWSTEYDYETSGLFPKRLICDTQLVSLPVECQLEFDREANVFEVVSSEDDYGDEENVLRSPKDIQDEQAILVKEIVFKNRLKHQAMLRILREKIGEIRSLEVAHAKKDDIKKAMSGAKKGSVCLMMTWWKEVNNYIDHWQRRGASQWTTKARIQTKNWTFLEKLVLHCRKRKRPGTGKHGTVFTRILKIITLWTLRMGKRTMTLRTQSIC
jgi:hypothetical protein